MQATFPRSALLVQDTAGHNSLAEPLVCTLRRVREYFQTGDVPREGTVCAPAVSRFSLNSTDPGSVFYVPGIGEESGVEEEDDDAVARRLFDVAVDVQELVVGDVAFGMVGVMGSAKARIAIQMAVERFAIDRMG